MSPCLFNFYAENIMRNAGSEETQAGIKIAGGEGRERWRRNRTGRPLSPSQIPQKNISTPSKLHKTTSVGWQKTSGNQKSRPLSSKTSILRHSAFFTVQLSHPYMITGKTIALTRRTLVGKVMSLLLNILSRLVTTFLPRSKRLCELITDSMDMS